MQGFEIQKTNIAYIHRDVIDAKGLLRVMPAEYWAKIPRNDVAAFMYAKGIYVLPTIELIAFIKQSIIGNAIEIGAGIGAIGRSLGIPTTDSKLQEDPAIKLYYEYMGQPVIQYPQDVLKYEALDACTNWKPDTVVGAFITHKSKGENDGSMYGVDEEAMMKLPHIKRYIMCGNLDTHAGKPLLAYQHKVWKLPDGHLITRSKEQYLNRVFIWTNNG